MVANVSTGIDSDRGWPTSFEIFVFAVSILSVVNIVLLLMPISSAQKDVIRIIDAVLCIVFLLDFAIRFRNSANKRIYMLRGGGWLDLLGSLPFPGSAYSDAFACGEWRTGSERWEARVSTAESSIIEPRARSTAPYFSRS